MRGKLFCMVTVLLLFCCAFALAEEPEGPVNPERMEVLNHSLVESTSFPMLRSTRLYSAAPTDEVTWSTHKDGEVAYDSACVFNVEASDGGDYQYEFYFGENSSVFGNSWVVYRQRKSTLNSFTLCPIVVPGEYRLLVNIYEITGATRLKQLVYRYDVAEDEDHPSLDAICDSILEDCRGATDFDTALNLHDWITHHAYYDNSLSYYGADGVLVRGYGVCDSYSKAYYLLLEKAGIPVARPGGANHAWNRIYLNGAWYQVDPTWDDNASGDCVSAVSGLESHEYFCVTDALMKASGHSYTVDAGAPCESLTMNYFAVRGGWDEWEISFLDDLQAGMALGRPGLGVSCPGETMRHLTILCSILNEQPQWTADYADGQSLAFRYDYGDTVFSVALADAGTLSGSWLYTVDENSATVNAWLGVRVILAVPSTLGGEPVKGIADRVFRGDTRLNTLTFPSSLRTLGEEALLGCTSLTSLTLPEAMTLIGDNALPEGIVLTCPKSSPLAKALGAADYPFIDSSEPVWTLQWVGNETLATVAYAGGTDTVMLPEGISGLGALDLGNTQLLRTGSSVIWTDTEHAAVHPPAIILCTASSEALEQWCALNGSAILTEDDRTILPGSLDTIEPEAFYGAALRWIVIPEGCTSIGDQAFAGCAGLKLVQIPESVTAIGSEAFESGVTILTSAGSEAALWAGNNGLTVLTE